MSVNLRRKRRGTLNAILRDWRLYVMLLLPLAFYIIFCYVPMAGVGIAFTRFNPVKGMWASKWVGFDNFKFVMKMPDFSIALGNTLLNFISAVCEVVDRSEALTDTVKTNGIMQQVLTFINSNYTQPMKIADLAKRFNISVSYLSHEFARFTKRSIYDYILYRRVMLAKEMMHTDASLNSIAYQCGFNDYSNFLRKFNQIVGVSPREFRHQLHGQNYRK